MTHDLHDVLDRTADLAGPAHFDADALWRQGTRTKRRSSLLAAASFVLVLALLSLTMWWGGSPTPGAVAPPADGVTTPAMPSHLYAVPSDVRPTSSRLDVGPVAAAFLSDELLPVAVSAIDGSYHVLDLPGYHRTDAQSGPPVSVSPQGERLAYAWHAQPPVVSGRYVPSGIRVVHLATGRIRTYNVPGGLGAQCTGLSWSASGRYLVFTCTINARFDQHSSTGTLGIHRLDLTTGRQIVVPIIYQDGQLAVGNDGAVAFATGDTVFVWSSRQIPATSRKRLNPQMVPASSVYWMIPRVLAMTGGSSPELGQQIQPNRTDRMWDDPPRPTSGEIVGAVSPGKVALLSDVEGEGLSVWSPSSGDAMQRVSLADGQTLGGYSFATSLLQRPTRRTAAPEWPADGAARIREAAPYAVVALWGGLMVLLVVRWVRRCRLLSDV